MSIGRSDADDLTVFAATDGAPPDSAAACEAAWAAKDCYDSDIYDVFSFLQDPLKKELATFLNK